MQREQSFYSKKMDKDLLLGAVFFEQKNYHEANRCLSRAESLYTETIHDLIQSISATSAAYDIKAFAELACPREDPSVSSSLARSYEKLKQRDINRLKSSIYDLRTKLRETHYYRAKSVSRLGQPEEAQGLFESVLKHPGYDSLSRESVTELIDLHLEQENSKAADRLLDYALNKDPSNTSFLAKKAILRYEAGDIQGFVTAHDRYQHLTYHHRENERLNEHSR